MDNNLTIALAVVGAALVGMLLMLTFGHDATNEVPPTPAYAVATLGDLQGTSVQARSPTVAVRLPDAEVVVVLRPILQSEFDAAQVQAIAPQLIEWQLLAAALVAPQIDPVDISTLPPKLVRFLKAKVNEISGFAVFP